MAIEKLHYLLEDYQKRVETENFLDYPFSQQIVVCRIKDCLCLNLVNFI